jgi:hypothetical protein
MATGSNLKWYAAASGGSPLAPTAGITIGNTYYASQTVNGCESAGRFAVTIQACENSLIFDGTNDFVQLPQTTLGNNATIEAWIKTSNAGTSFRAILVREFQYGIFLNDNQLMTFNWSASGNVGATTYTGVTLNDNQWHHVAVVRNGMASNNTKLYVDGIMNTQFSISYTINYNANNALLISKNDPNGSPESITKFQGSLSNLRIVKGTAVYTSNFTPPTTSLSNISGTALLLFNNPSDLFVDGSPNNYTVTKFTSPNFPTASADSPVTYSPSGSPAPCFKENSKILCLVDGMEKERMKWRGGEREDQISVQVDKGRRRTGG